MQELAKIKILHVVASAGMYGKEQVLLELMRQHRELGIPSILGSIRVPGDSTKEIEKVAESEGLAVQPFVLNRSLDFRGARKIVRYGKKHGVTLLHIHDYKGSILLGLQKWCCSMPPLLRTLHGFTTTSSLSKIAVYEWLDRQSLRFHQGVIGVSDDMRDIVPMKVEVIKNGISPLLKSPMDGNEENKEIVRFCSEGTILGSVGRLSHEKNQLELIDALALLVERNLPVKLLLLGEGEERATLESRVAEKGLSNHVLMPGFVSEARQLLQLIDVYVQPSIREGTPISILEAMEARVPLCMSSVGAMRLLLSRGAGHEVPLDALGMADAMQKVLEDDTLRESITQKAHDIFTQEYASSVMAQAYLGVYQRLCKSNS